MKWHLSTVIVLLIIFGTSWVVAENAVSNPTRGQSIYERLCLRCHGEKLDGRGPEAKFLTVPPADLRSLSSRIKSDFELLVIMAHGVMFTPMHGFRDLLDEQEMRDVLSYIRTVAPFEPVT